MVRRHDLGTLWAVTDGAFSRPRAWVDGEGRRRISDVGRAIAYRHTRDQALLLAHQVAEIEAACYQAEVAAAGPDTPAPCHSEHSRTWEWLGPMTVRDAAVRGVRRTLFGGLDH
ncbi:hypothetical protein [Streptomyces sp. NPDC048312]|uniref:hypothetical protein n=1 Tax=Streptomyces sp. NPDC048312 TaxID=3155485 RepID=UPI00340666D0